MDPYKILGVGKSASQDEIKNAYRALAKKHHPDLNPGNKESETKFKSISAAYELIGDKEMRAKFDRGETPEQMEAAAREYASSARGGPSYYETQQDGGRYSQHFGGAGAEDFFENIFRQANQGRSKRGPVNYPGEDQVFVMEVEFRDAILGAQREISLPNGKNLQVKIPPGVESGSKLRFKGQGDPGKGSAPAGDLYLELRVKPLKGFKRVGDDLETQIAVSFLEAIKGAQIPVATIDGSVSLKIPAGISSGARLRIRGKGVVKNGKAGDQIVVVRIVMPQKISPELEAAVSEWGDKFNYDPRAQT